MLDWMGIGGAMSGAGQHLAARQYARAMKDMQRANDEMAFMAQYRDWPVKPTFERRYGGLVAVVERPTNIPRVAK